MNIEQLAKHLNGREYPLSILADLRAEMVARGYVLVVGASDDYLMFHGAISESSYEMDVAVDQNGIRKRACHDADCPHDDALLAAGPRITGTFNPKGDGPSWRIDANIPHAKFQVMEDGEVNCEAVVFCLRSAFIHETDVFTLWEPTDAEIASACMSYRHDFGILEEAQREAIKRTAREWLRVWKREFSWSNGGRPV